jgi:hypothetical protein
MFQTKVIEKIKTHILCSTTLYFLSKIVLFFEIMWKNIAEPGKPQMATWRMRVARCIPKATDTHSVYVILIAFPPQQ